MKKILSFVAVTFVSFVSCTREMEFRQALTDIACDVSAIMPEFKSGGDIADTKASLESVVRINWSAGDKLAIINLTTGKQLGGCLVADNNGSKTSFSPTNLVGTISAGDKLVFWYNPSDDIIVEQEQMYSPISVDLTEQNGGQDDVPIVGYAQYTASADNEINAENIAFTFLVSYIQLALSALPASTSITALEVSNVNSKGEFRINDGNFVFEKTKGKVKLIDPFTANSKGANVRYFSMFQSEAEVSARVATITANGQEYQTTWIKSAINNGNYYQSVATGFANEFIQFSDEAFKAYCVSHYDGNGDGEISFAEAAAVTSYANFSDEERSSIVSIYELAYFPAQLGLPKFEGCTALKNIAIPGTVTKIPDNCFKGCSSLGEIHIPDNVTVVGKNAFEGCTSLTHFSGLMASEDARFLIRDEHLFAFAQGSTNHVTMPDVVRVIEEGVFTGCSSIKTLVLSPVKNIGKKAFYGCSNLMAVTLLDGLEHIGDDAFRNCSKLTKVYSQCYRPAELGMNVFEGCGDDLRVFVSEQIYPNYVGTDWSLNYKVTSQIWNKIYYTTTDNEPLDFFFDNKWVGGQSLSSPCRLVSNVYKDGEGVLTFDSDIYSLINEWYGFGEYSEEYAEWWGFNSMFTHQTRLKSLVLPDCLTRMPSIRGCANLISISIPESVTELVNWENNGCPVLSHFTGSHTQFDGKFVVFGDCLTKAAHVLPEELEIPSSYRSIAGEAFMECMTLRKVVIPESIQSIGTFAFRPCQIDEYWFKSMTPPEMPLGGGAAPLWFSENGKIYVPSAAVDTYMSAGYEWTEEYASRIVGY